MDISKFLLPREQYAEESKKYTGVFSTFEISKSNQILFYFGANHARDINNPQYPALREYWNKFLDITKNENTIIFIEGGLRKLEESEELAIIKSSEGGYITFLAKGNTKIISPDGSMDDLFKKIGEIDKKEALLYKFLSYVDSYHRISEPRPGFSEWTSDWIKRESRNEFWNGIELSFETLKSLYREIIGKDFNHAESQNNFVNPNRTDTRINVLARKMSDFRDLNIVSEIEKYWKEGKSIFVVFGRGHLIIQKPALQVLFN